MTTGGLSVTVVWFGDAALGHARLSPFGELAAEGIGAIEQLSFLTLQSRHDEAFAWSRRYYCKGGFWTDVTDAAIDTMLEAISKTPAPDCEVSVLQLGGAVSDISDETTAYTGRGAGYYWLSEPVWDVAADDEACIDWGRATGTSLTDQAFRGNYINEQADTSIAFDAYGSDKYERLARLKATYDPRNVFRLNQNIGPIVGTD